MPPKDKYFIIKMVEGIPFPVSKIFFSFEDAKKEFDEKYKNQVLIGQQIAQVIYETEQVWLWKNYSGIPSKLHKYMCDNG